METSTTVNKVDEKLDKRPRIRSVAYPSYTLESSVKIGTKINGEFSSLNFIPIDAISKFIGLSGGAFLMQLSSCVQYGLLQLKKREGYKPTELLNNIIKPLPNENVDDSLLQCLMKPELYKKLFHDFKDKQLPSESGLANTLDRLYSVKGNGAKLAAKVFLKNITTAKLVSPSNELKISSYIPFVELNEIENSDEEDDNSLGVKIHQTFLPVTNETTTKTTTPNQYLKDNNEFKEIPIFLSNKREAKVMLPIDFSDDDLNRIVKILSAYVS